MLELWIKMSICWVWDYCRCFMVSILSL